MEDLQRAGGLATILREIAPMLDRESETTPLSRFERESVVIDVLNELFGSGVVTIFGDIFTEAQCRFNKPVNLKQLNPAEVDRIFALLRDSNLAVREMARFSLANADPVGFRESGYESGTTKERYEMQALRWYQSWQRRSK